MLVVSYRSLLEMNTQKSQKSFNRLLLDLSSLKEQNSVNRPFIELNIPRKLDSFKIIVRKA